MTDPVFVDTGHLVGLLVSDDAHHQAAVRWSHVVREQRIPLVISTAIFLETGNKLSRPRIWPRARLFIQALMEDPAITKVTVDDALIAAAMSLRDRYQDKSWGLVDCTSFVIMQSRNITAALSCDQHFTQAGFKALLLDPA